MSLVPEKLGNLKFQIGSLWLKGRRSRDGNKKQILIDIRARDLLPALPGDLVWIPDRREQGTIGDEIAPRSYKVKSPSNTFRRNRRDIICLSAEDMSPTRPESHDSDSD